MTAGGVLTLPQHTPGFEQVALAVIEEDVGLPPLGEQGVRAALADVPFDWAFAWTARIDAVLRHGRRSRPDAGRLSWICNVITAPPNPRERFDPDYHLALLTRSGVTNATEPLVEAITRAYAIYYELPRRDDASEMPNLDFRCVHSTLLFASRFMRPGSCS